MRFLPQFIALVDELPKSLGFLAVFGFYSLFIPNIFLSIPAMDFGAFTTTIFTNLHLRHNSIITPIAISNTHSTNTRKPEGNTTPARIPIASAIAHITQTLPLLWHIATHRLSHVFYYILRKRRFVGEISICPKAKKAHSQLLEGLQLRSLPVRLK